MLGDTKSGNSEGVARQRKQYISLEEEGFSLLFVIFTLPVTELHQAGTFLSTH